MPATSSDFVNVTLSSSDGKLMPASLSTITVSGTWNNSGVSSASFDGNNGTVSFDGGGAQSLTSGGISFNFLNTSTDNTDLTIQDALIVDKTITIAANTTLDAGSNQDISVGLSWTNSGTFTSASGTVTFNGSLNQVITTGGVGTGNDFYNLTIANTGSPADPLDVETSGAIKVTGTLDVQVGQFMPATSSEFLDVTVSASGGILKPASSSSITVSGNWSDVSGTFTPNSGTVVMDGSSKTIATGASNEFYNLTIDGTVTTSTSNDVNVQNLLTVNSSKTLTVSPGDVMTLENATIAGTLTVNTDGSNSTTLDFSTATGTVDFAITGTLNLDGENDTRRAIVSGDGDSRIDFDISGTGVLNADYFNMSYPTDAGFKINSSGTQVISYGNFDGPDGASGVLLDISSTGTISSPSAPGEITGCFFNNTGLSGTDGINVKADASSQAVTFTSFGGTLASSASVAELNDSDNGDPGDKIFFFNNEFYSHNNNNPNTVGNWYSATNGTGISPSDFTNGSHKFIIQSGDTYTATGTWSVAGEIQVVGTLDVNSRTVTMTGATDVDGTLIISTGTYNADGASDIAGTLSITGTGVYDADNTFTAASGAVTFTGAGFLRCDNTVTDLGTLSTGAGTVQYDGGVQNVLADDYYNLIIDQSGNKTAQGAVNVANDMTISNSATYLTANYTTTVTGATSVGAILEVNSSSGIFHAGGGFSASGNINFSANGILRFITVSPTSLGTLDNTEGRVIYKNGATNVLADDYHNLQVVDGGTARTAQGDINVSGDFIIGSSSELNLGNNTLTITGDADINGILDFDNAGVFDANDEFDATGGTVQFTGSGGSLKLGGATVTSLGNTLTEGTGTVEYDYAGNQTVLSETYYNLTINNSTGVKTAGGALDIDGDLTITAGELAMDGNNADVATGKTITVGPDGTSDGTLSITTGTFTANGSSSDINGTLIINGAGVYDADGDFDGTSGAVRFNGSGGSLRLGGATVTSIGGTFVHGTGTVEYDYFGNQSVKARNYYNLEIDGNNTSHVKSVVNGFTVDNNLTVSSTSAFDVLDKTIIVTGASDINGILNINGSGILDANGSFDATSGSITMAGTARLQLNSTVTSLGTLDDAAGTVEYDQDGTQTILSAHTYYDLEIDGSGSKSTDGNTTANGDVSITAAGTLDIGTGNDNLTIGENFTNGGTFTTSGETITFNGSTENTSSLISDATVDLIINKSGTGGITFGGNSSFDDNRCNRRLFRYWTLYFYC